ncbi:MAG: hypothetical protein AABY01_01840, partial [Nanoarchaeota archaeon]
SLKSLDELIKMEAGKVVLPKKWKASFSSYGTPGDGTFYVEGFMNNFAFSYNVKTEEAVSLELKQDADIISVTGKKGVVELMRLNDLTYFNNDKSLSKAIDDFHKVVAEEMDMPVPVRRQSEHDVEQAEALRFGQQALNAVKKYVQLEAPALTNLMNGYFSRSLMDFSAQPGMKTNKEIFDCFNLRLSEKA